MLSKHVFRSVFVLSLLALVFASPSGVLADGGADHQAAQARPISLGTSGGNVYDRTSIYCCSGTLGALVEDSSGFQYILSNNHVLGRFNQAVAGDPVNQPGMIDQNCSDEGTVAHFSALVPIQTSKGRRIKYNEVDAAMAQVVPGMVDASGSLIDIGPVSANTVAAFLGQSVQKSGRTTGHTYGTVVAIDVTTSVGYSKECGGASNQVAYFQNQIRIENADFSTSGDSGSLIVEAGAADPNDGLPRAVALLFAGDSSSTVANPINSVLSALGVTIVGGTPVDPGPTGTIAGTVTSSDGGGPVADAVVSAGIYTGVSDASGAYSIAGVPVGSYTVSASAIGFDSASSSGVNVVENATTTVDLTMTPRAEPTVSLPGCIVFTTTGGKNADRNIRFTRKVVDDFGAPVSGAVVDISVTKDGASFGDGTGASTDSTGSVTYQARNAGDGTYVVTVTNIAASGLAFAGASSTPANSFVKGTDATPAEFCADGVSPSGSAAPASAVTLRQARNANANASASLMGLNSVVGHGVGLSSAGNAVVEVYVLKDASPADHAALPSSVGGVPVRIVETDGFVAY